VVRQGQRKDKTIASNFGDLTEKYDSESVLQRPSAEEELKIAEKTRAALQLSASEKLASAQPQFAKHNAEPTFIRYTPSNQNEEFNSGAKQRIIRLQAAPVDPLEPPKFKHKKLPAGPPSPPVPVMHSPPRKVTVADQQTWKIPPCISNWKNIKGYTIPLDKRLAADGRGLQEVQINNKFAALSESLFIAERNARKEIEARANVLKQLQRKEKENKETELARLAAKAREQGGGLRGRETEDEAAVREKETEEDVDSRESREDLRRDRKREIRRDQRMEQRKAEKRGAKGVAGRPEERDVSEKIALGQAVPKGKDTMFDQRLFNQNQGLDTGMGADDTYNVYDKPLFKGSSANYIYRPSQSAMQDLADDAEAAGADGKEVQNLLEKGSSTSKFKPDRGFKGSDKVEVSQGGRSKPVEFEKEKADPYGLSELLESGSTGGSKRKTLDSIGKKGGLSASAGGASSGDALREKDSHRKSQIDFEESSSSFSSSLSRKDKDRSGGDDRDSKRRRH